MLEIRFVVPGRPGGAYKGGAEWLVSPGILIWVLVAQLVHLHSVHMSISVLRFNKEVKPKEKRQEVSIVNILNIVFNGPHFFLFEPIIDTSEEKWKFSALEQRLSTKCGHQTGFELF